MPTYRVPVRVTVQGYLEIEADDPFLASKEADSLDAFEDFDLSTGEWVGWEVAGEPREMK